MTTIQKSVDRGLEIRAQMESLKEELDEIEDCLRQAALAGEQVELEDPDREGRQWFAPGTEAVVPVVITADMISQSFADGGKVHAKLQELAGCKLGEFYRACTTWKMLARTGKAFRQEAFAVFGSAAGEFVSAATAKDKNGIAKTSVRVEWERAEEAK